MGWFSNFINALGSAADMNLNLQHQQETAAESLGQRAYKSSVSSHVNTASTLSNDGGGYTPPYISDTSNNGLSAESLANFDEAQRVRDWQEYMSNTSHQREVADLKAAGLNPILSANNGAASYSGAMGSSGQSVELAKLSAQTQLQAAKIAANSAYSVAQLYTDTSKANTQTQAAANLVGSLIGLAGGSFFGHKNYNESNVVGDYSSNNVNKNYNYGNYFKQEAKPNYNSQNYSYNKNEFNDIMKKLGR